MGLRTAAEIRPRSLRCSRIIGGQAIWLLLRQARADGLTGIGQAVPPAAILQADAASLPVPEILWNAPRLHGNGSGMLRAAFSEKRPGLGKGHCSPRSGRLAATLGPEVDRARLSPRQALSVQAAPLPPWRGKEPHPVRASPAGAENVTVPCCFGDDRPIRPFSADGPALGTSVSAAVIIAHVEAEA
jgi:hypothetical protein